MTADNTPPTQNTDWTDQQLPPVKPPTTGFLMQLFFVPMIIVSIIVGVWIMFGWLAQSGTNPKQLSENLRQLNKGSWQDAHSLANLLRDVREKELRKDGELADNLAETMVMLIEDPNLSVSPERHKLATYLCHALGEFEIDNGLNALITAVKTEDFKLRRAAVEGIAVLSSKLGPQLDESRAELVAALREPAMERAASPTRDEQLRYGEIRVVTAYALGIIGGDEACNTLNLMLGDAYPDARYNAATGLARNGDTRAVERLCEMLQIENDEAIKYESDDESASTLREWKRNLIIKNGLLGVVALYTANKEAKPDESIVQAVQKITDANILKSNDETKYKALDEATRIIKERS